MRALKLTGCSMAAVAAMLMASQAQAAVIATLSFDTPTGTVASNADIPVWMTLTLDPSSDPITTDASGYVTSPLSAQTISDLNGNSTGVYMSESVGCGDTLDACNGPSSAYTFSFNRGANTFAAPANLDLEPGDSLDILLGTFTPNGGNAPAGTYEFNIAYVSFGYHDSTSDSTYLADIAHTPTPFDRTVFSVSAAPEPATWAMFLMGFGAVGFGLRATRRGKAVTA